MIIFKILHTNKNNIQVNFNGNLEEKHPMLFFIEEVKDTAEFFKRNCESIETFFVLLFFFNMLKSQVKNGIEVILNLSSNVVSESNDEPKFLSILLLTNTQAFGLRKVSASCFCFDNLILTVSPANIKLSKTQLSQMAKPGCSVLGKAFFFDFLGLKYF